ncbi:MAG: flagellar hook-basal body complex protein FliE [Rhodocyclaceae bacterium]|jgi:flagellar hook-basal body complex protein FliE|nr:flagellar hook-basal body complex protein FliE [Rhodocyclaceae bacterium]
MDTRGIEQMIGELRSTAQVASGKSAAQSKGVEGQVDFAEVLNNTLKDVSAASQEARAMAKDFSAGDPDVKLQDVMVNLEKASLSFQQMVQVRNRLVTAYQDIMNMPV